MNHGGNARCDVSFCTWGIGGDTRSAVVLATPCCEVLSSTVFALSLARSPVSGAVGGQAPNTDLVGLADLIPALSGDDGQLLALSSDVG